MAHVKRRTTLARSEEAFAIHTYIQRAMNARRAQGLPDEIEDSKTLDQLIRLMNSPKAVGGRGAEQTSRGAA
jgi:replicative DNA helicase